MCRNGTGCWRGRNLHQQVERRRWIRCRCPVVAYKLFFLVPALCCGDVDGFDLTHKAAE